RFDDRRFAALPGGAELAPLWLMRATTVREVGAWSPEPCAAGMLHLSLQRRMYGVFRRPCSNLCGWHSTTDGAIPIKHADPDKLFVTQCFGGQDLGGAPGGVKACHETQHQGADTDSQHILPE